MSFENTRMSEMLNSLPETPGKIPLMLQASVTMALMLSFQQAMKEAGWSREKIDTNIEMFKALIGILSPELVESKDFAAVGKALISDIRDIKAGNINLR